jgi:predicted Rossmann fold nucleotide-binding protein DprA/Smf involved in DNA uptake
MLDFPPTPNTQHLAPMDVDPEAVLLCQIPGLGAATLRRLLARWETAAAILRAPSAELRAAGVPPATVARIVAAPRQQAATEAGIRSLERMGITSVPFLAPTYPQRLRDLDAPPLLLYVQGRWPTPAPSIALFGTAADETEAHMLKQILRELAGLHIGVLVGADGIESAPATHSVCVLGYGLLLARSRVPDAMHAAIKAGDATLVSVVPINAQSTPTSEATAVAVRAAWSDGVLLAAAVPPTSLDLRSATHCWSLPSQPPAEPSRFTTLKPDLIAATRQIARALGVQRTATATVKQERLW